MEIGLFSVYLIVLFVFAGLPLLLDMFLAYQSVNKTRRFLIEKASADKFELKELQEVIKEIGKPPPGIPGLARAVIALTVIVILGVAVFHILVVSGEADASKSPVVSNVLSMLGGLLAAITGFYFGGKTAEKKPEGEGKT